VTDPGDRSSTVSGASSGNSLPPPPPSGTPYPVRALLGRGSIYTLALVIQLSSGILTLPLVTRLLPRDEYGVVALALLVLLFVGAVATAGLPSVILRTFYAEDNGPAECRRLILSGLWPALACAGFAELTSPLWTAALGGLNRTAALHIAVWTVIPSVITALCASYARTSERPVLYAILTLVSGPGGQVLGVILLAVLPDAGVTEYMAGVAGGYALAAAVGLGVIAPWPDGFASREAMRSSLAVGLPLIAHGVAWTTLALGDRAVIQRLNGAADVGLYHAGYTVGALSLSLVSAIANAWTPIVYGTSAKRRWGVHSDTLAAVQVLAALVASILALAGPPLLQLATPPSYHASSLPGVVATVAISAFPWIVYGGATQILLWHKRTRPLAWITPLAAVVNVVLVALLLPPLGLEGAALATLLAYSLLAALSRHAVGDLAPMRNFPRRTVVAWTSTLGLAAVGGLSPVTGIWLGIRGFLALGVGVAFLLSVRWLIAKRPLDEAAAGLRAPVVANT
jgi:O-antigen/teichoic acid export membrane protein